MKQPFIHQYNETTKSYDVREMTEEERIAYEAAQAEPIWIYEQKE